MTSTAYRPADWRRALAAFERWSRTLPDELASILIFTVLPDELEPEPGTEATPWLLIRCADVSIEQDLAGPHLERLRTAAPPELETDDQVSWTQWPSSRDRCFPTGSRGVWTNAAFSEIDEDVLDELLAIAAEITRPGVTIDVHHLGGAFARIPEGATAFPDRSARLWMNVYGFWHEQADDAPLIEYTRRFQRSCSSLPTAAGT